MSDRLIAGLWNWNPHLEMCMELLVSYDGPRAASPMCFPGADRWLLWIGASPSAMQGAQLNQSRCQRLTAGIWIQYTSKTEPCWWVVVCKYYLAPHEMKWMIHWLVVTERHEWDYDCQKIKWKQELKNSTHLIPPGDVDVFPCHLMGLYSVKTVSNLKYGK